MKLSNGIALGDWFLGLEGRMLSAASGFIKLREELMDQLIDTRHV
jgi:hypothetical protein